MALINDKMASKILGGLLFFAFAYILYDKMTEDDDAQGTGTVTITQPAESDELQVER